MTAFKRFEPGDLIDNVLVLEPTWDLSSGSNGWDGSPEGSASVSLYGGYNRQPGGVVQQYVFQRTIQGTDSFGKLTRSEPITSSVHFVYMTNEERNLGERSDERWGYEHWKTVMRLYDYYKRRDPDYVTSSYDYYCLYFQGDSRNIVRFGPAPSQMSSSWTVESWVKPFATASSDHDFTIAAKNYAFWLGITGSTGRLTLGMELVGGDPLTYFTASSGPTVGEWSHVAARYDASTGTGSFSINGVSAGTFLPSGPISQVGIDNAFTVGNVLSGAVLFVDPAIATTNRGFTNRSFYGFVGETRLWHVHRSDTELSSSMRRSLTGSLLWTTGSVVCARFTDGPLATFPQASVFGAVGPALGSGTVDATAMEQVSKGAASRYPWGLLCSFDDRNGPVWHPNDNSGFYPPKRLAGPPVCDPEVMSRAGTTTTGSGYESVSRMLVATVPAGMYGRRIVPNSVTLRCNTFDGEEFGLRRVLLDDGRGGLYLSGSANPNYAPDYPSSAQELNSIMGSFGALPTYGWLCDDLTGSLTASFGNQYLAPSDMGYGNGYPQYRFAGPGPSGSDYAVKMTYDFGGNGPAFTGSNSTLNVTATDDMFFVWVAKLESNLADGRDHRILDKNNGLGQGYRVAYYNTGGQMTASLTIQNTLNGTANIYLPVGASVLTQWHTGMAVLDRATGMAYIVIATLDGTVYSAGTSFPGLGTMTTPSTPFTIGARNGVDWQLAALYAGTEAGTITTNVSGALAAFANVIRASGRLPTQTDHDSVVWNKVGNVFYDEGLIVIKDPALLDFAANWSDSSDHPEDLLHLSFRGESRIPVKTFMCRIDRGDLNASLNKTFWREEEDGDRVRRHPSGSIYVSTVGLYNSDRELVGVARLAEPLRVRPRDRMNVKLRMDF